MTDWKNPTIIIAELSALVKLYHAMGGLFIWEFLVNIEFDYSFFTGRRKFRPSFLLYLGARCCPLFAVIAIFVALDSTHQINCQAYIIFVFIFAHLSFAFASALIVLRIAAIWGLNKIAVSIASAAWLASASSQIHSIAIVHATWGDSLCEITNTPETKINIIVTGITDWVLLALMFIGLLRWEKAHQRGGVWWLLYTQGLAWIIIVIAAEVPTMVFILLNLNAPMNLMFQVPALIIMAIGASRIYRGMADYFLHNEANVHISVAMNKPPPACLVARPDQHSFVLESRNMHVGHIIEMDSLVQALGLQCASSDEEKTTNLGGNQIV